MTDEELKSLFETLRQESASAHIETRRDFNLLETLEEGFADLQARVERLESSSTH